MENLSVDALHNFLSSKCDEDLKEAIQILKDQKINGKKLLKLDRKDFSNLGIAYGDAMELVENIKILEVPELVEPVDDKPPPAQASTKSTYEVAGQIDNIASGSKMPHSPVDTHEESADDSEDEDQDSYDDIKQFFESHDFKEMGSYEKQSYRRKYENYNKMCAEIGKENVKLPDFMNKEKKEDCKPKPNKMKKKVVKEKTVDKSEKENIPGQSNSSGSTNRRSKRVTVSSSEITPKKRKTSVPMKCCFGPKDMAEDEYMSQLPCYDIDDILLEGGSKLKQVRKLLAENGICFDNPRRLMIRTLTNYLFYGSVESPNEINVFHKEGMAASLVERYPFFADSSDENKYSWFRIFDRSNNSGWMANCIQNIYRQMEPEDRRRAGRSKPKPTTENTDTEEREDDPNYHPKEHKYLALMMAVKSNQKEILAGMEESFAARRGWMKRTKPTITDVVKHYPHLMTFEGQILEEEFNRLHPGCGSLFIKNFPTIVEKLKVLETSLEHVDGIVCEELAAYFTLAKLLGRPNLLRHKNPEAKIMPSLDTLLSPLSKGKDPKKTADEVRQSTKAHVQPFILALIEKKKIHKLWVVCDSELLEMKSSSVLKGLDVLFKAYCVFEVEYPTAWKYLFQYLERCVYKISVYGRPTNAMAELGKKLERTQLISK